MAEWDLPKLDVSDLRQAVANEVMDRIVRRTPVDTGRAQNGWYLTPVSDDQISINNDVPYIGYLEEGTCKMTAFGMVRTTLEEVDDIIKDKTKEHPIFKDK
jgi:hypothetical protein